MSDLHSDRMTNYRAMAGHLHGSIDPKIKDEQQISTIYLKKSEKPLGGNV